MEYVYHGSSTHGIKTLIPHQSTHGNYVYATPDRAIAIIMSMCCGNDSTYYLGREGKDEKFNLVERVPGAFKKMFSNSFSLYTLDASKFKNIHTGFNEVVTEEEVEVLKEERYDSLSDAIEELKNSGFINVYYYPERPDYIPEDDMDLVQVVRRYIYEMGKKLGAGDIAAWIFLHPNLEEEFRIIAKEQGLDIPSYEEICERFNELQKAKPDREFFVECANKMRKLFKNSLD